MKTVVQTVCIGSTALWAAIAPVRAETVMQQCGQQYQAAKAAGTLAGMTWNQFRTDCAAKARPIGSSAAPAAAAAAPPAQIPAAPPNTGTTPAASSAATAASRATATAGRTAMLAREKQCGAEWRAQKVSLVAANPALTWPRYWSQCNTRLKAAVH